jgi:multimeric flavodoxin WrbA
MIKKILILNGSPKKNGNTAALVDWFCKGAIAKGAEVAIVHIASLKYKTPGCTSCRACQKSEKYECVVNDDAKPILAKMAEVDVIVFATPLYFFSASAQTKVIFDRLFCLYKWDNDAGTMQTPLKGKTLVVLASAFEEIGLDVLEKSFALTAEYTGMKFESLLVANAGASGEIAAKRPDIEKIVTSLGSRIAE